MLPDEHYTHPRLAEIYDAGNGWSIDRDFYLELAGTTPRRILDLGCGTGLLCHAYAEKGHVVTGVDPAASMLEVARGKTNGLKIEWVLSTSQFYSSDKKFDLIIMTGHAFQVLLTEDDVRMSLATMKKHLADGGFIAFESRNPGIDWSVRWNKSTHLVTSTSAVLVERRVKKHEHNFIHFETYYRFSDETLVSQSRLRFWALEEIDGLLGEQNLSVVSLYGDWGKGPYVKTTSEEVVFIIQRAR